MKHRVLNAERMTWTPAADAKLLHLFAQGLNKIDIAREMGASISAVEARYRKVRNTHVG